ncbi:hypothetical protein Hanom_Chr15g01377981 [Helianthus anomalus]
MNFHAIQNAFASVFPDVDEGYLQSTFIPKRIPTSFITSILGLPVINLLTLNLKLKIREPVDTFKSNER